MGAPRNDEERADRGWIREQAAGVTVPAHRAMVLEVGGGYFRSWCSSCGRYVSGPGRDKERQQYLAGAHQRENEVKDA